MKRGFTLVELLAVIAILAIISLIAVPIVINIINDAKEESLKKSVQSYLDGVGNAITQENLKIKYNPDECKINEDGDLICSKNGNELTTSNGTNKLIIDIKGKKPSSGTIKLKDGKVIDIIDIYLDERNYISDDKGNIIISKIQTSPGLYDEEYNLIASWEEVNNCNENENFIGMGTLNYEKIKQGKILIIPDNITEILDYAFQGCDNLTNIIIPNSVTSMGDYAFQGCQNLTSIIIPDSVTQLNNYIFSGCIKINNVIIPSNVNYIGVGAFSGCTGLTNVTFENIKGWSTNGDTTMDVTNSTINAKNLKDTSNLVIWKRS